MSGYHLFTKKPERPMVVLLYYGDNILKPDNGIADDAWRMEIGYWDGRTWRVSGTNHEVFEFDEQPAPTYWSEIEAPPGGWLSNLRVAPT